jgi:hypothetical protein
MMIMHAACCCRLIFAQVCIRASWTPHAVEIDMRLNQVSAAALPPAVRARLSLTLLLAAAAAAQLSGGSQRQVLHIRWTRKPQQDDEGGAGLASAAARHMPSHSSV